MSSESLSPARTASIAAASPIGIALAGATIALTVYQFVVRAWLAPGTAEHAALGNSPFVVAGYIAAVGCAALLVPRAIARSIDPGEPTPAFSAACVIAAAAGYLLFRSVGDEGVGAATMGFYWGGLALLWGGSIAMIHLCRRIRKPLAVRDWTLYAAAMALIPLTLVPSLPLWPLFFELDPGETLMTAATSSFAAHMLIAHYVIFEILERRRRRS